MTYEFIVDPGALRAQAEQVRQVAQSLNEPITYMTLGSDAYGVMCGFASAPTNLLGIGAQASLRATRDLLTRAAALVHTIAGEFEEQEQEYCIQIAQLDAQLGTVEV